MKKISFLTLPVLLALILLGLFLWLSAPAKAAAGPCSVPGSHPTIQAAVDDPNCTTINVAAGTFGGAAAITRSVSIIGASPNSTFIDGGGGGPIFYAIPGLTLSVESLTIQNGITPEGTGFYNEGSRLTLSNTRFMSNTATGIGGGLYNLGGQVTILNSEFLSNSAILGGGIYNTGAITVVQTVFQGNSAASAGGGLYNGGGGIVERSQFVNNTAVATGGAVSNHGNLLIRQTSIDDNFTMSGTGSGGGISNSDDLTVIGSAIINNNAIDGGGVINNGSLAMINSTVSGNNGNGGGGLQNRSLASISYSTFSDNNGLAGGGILMITGTMNLNSTIIALNPGGGDCFIAGGVLISQDYNLDGDNSCNLSQPNDLPGMPPLLGPLQNNGGWTQTQALMPGSPGIDSGDSATCPPEDQRGFPRPIGPACDIGAYEAGMVVYLPAIRKP